MRAGQVKASGLLPVFSTSAPGENAMSHGGGGDASACDPNLTPLLDLVLQLLMFFIMCTNFSSAQVSGDIQLPYSDSAKPIEKADAAAVYLNIKSLRSKEFRANMTEDQLERFKNQDVVILVPGMDPQTMLEIKLWLKKLHEDAEKLAEGGEVKTVINFRPDGDVELNQLFQLMQFCKTAGYKRLKMRAKIRVAA
jgi:biopolymer transport protein ExbD